MLKHGTCVTLGQRAALLRGASGSGKSDLAYRFLNLPPNNVSKNHGNGTHLVSDDQVLLSRRENIIWAAPPTTIAGKLELRNIGIITLPYVNEAELQLLVDLSPPGEIPRLPDWTATEEILGLPIPVIALAPFEPSAPLKLRAALEMVELQKQNGSR